MLVLTRRLDESILIGEDIEIKIVQVRGTGPQAVVRLGISAPRSVTVLRKEIYDEVVAANRQSAQGAAPLPAELLRALTPHPPAADRTGKREESQGTAAR